MKINTNIKLADVQDVYNGPEGRLWELLMGEQIHIGGLASSMDLAEKAAVTAGTRGVDLCCCTGAGMRFLVRFKNVAEMCGVDATETVINLGIERAKAEGYSDRISFVANDVCNCGIDSNSVDFVWGEDAWCYVEDKTKLIAEAARIVKPGGIIAFTDWLEGPVLMSDDEAARFLAFMKFPNIQTLDGYKALLTENGCDIREAYDTGRYVQYIDLYIDMANKQLTYDALKIIGFDMDLLTAIGNEMEFMRQLARDGKIIQGLFVAQKNS